VKIGPLTADAVDPLLYDLCVELGFCLPPEVRARLRASPPPDVDSFTDTVMTAEGLDPMTHEPLRRQVRERVRSAFEQAAGTSR
jgi:hypothetical protein